MSGASGGGGYGDDGSAYAYAHGQGGLGGGGGGALGVGGAIGRRSHARSASHGGIMINRDPPTLDQGMSGTMPVGVGGGMGGNMGVTGGALGRVGKGHQRTFSHGQLVEGGRGHRRHGSKTDFILPAGHEQREREREQHKKTPTRSSSFPKGHSRQASRSESLYTIRQHNKTFLQKIMFWKKIPEESRTRVLVPNHVVSPHVPLSEHPNGGYPDNRICTTKYTLLSFIPKNLFEQFHRFANLYFLFIVLLNFVPAVNAFGKEVAMCPLIFVLGITAVKDAFEDRRRYRSDNRVNNATCRVYNRDQNRYVKTNWKHVRVGDIVHLSCNEDIPADIVVLNSSDDYGVCFIESSNLDGESNLKQRQSVKGLGMDEVFEVSKFDYRMEVGAPTTKIYHFSGTIPLPSGERVPLTKDNLLLRDCTLRNTDYIEGIVVYAGRETKAMLNNGGTRYKRSKLERRMNLEVMWCVVILFVMCIISATGSGLWQNWYDEKNVSAGYVPFVPPETLDGSSIKGTNLSTNPIWVGFISFWTFIIIYQVIIPISLYVTIEIIKLMQIYHIHHDKDFKDKKSGKTIECRALNIPEELGQVEYVFTDKTGTLTENNMVFQRCSINGIDYGHTPVILNKNVESSERDTFTLNNQLQEELTSIELPMIYTQPGSRQNPATPPLKESLQRVLDFFITLAVCNTVIVAKYPHRDEMNASGTIVPNESVNSSTISEVDNASYDTSTSNLSSSYNSSSNNLNTNSWGPSRLLRGIMSLSRPLSPIASSPRSTPPHTPESSPRYPPSCNLTPNHHSSSPPVMIMLNPMDSSNDNGRGSAVVNHSLQNAVPTRPSLLDIQSAQIYNANLLRDTRSLTPSPMDIKPIYEAESPDELALVDAAYKYGCRLLKRSLHNVLISLPGYGLCEFEVLHVMPFDSNRKRMSIIVRHPETHEKILYCKGADSAILDNNLSRAIDDKTKLRIFRTQQQLNSYSKRGLRVLCMAKRVLSDTEYEDWAMKHKEAENALANREHRLQESYHRIERNLELIGATGIEDRLQDGVPETIQSLRDAGIVVWVLTGDKQETAINIAYSCSLFSSNMEILKLNARTKDQTDRTIKFFLQQIEQEEASQAHASARGAVGSLRGKDNEFSNVQANSHRVVNTPKDRGLVVDGRTLVFILDRRADLKKSFLMLAQKCSSVLCCRATPLQKSLIVRSAKDSLKVLTLAVGDGANDVSMIQTADVGIGISGLEGKQAVMASDFAIARFRHLEKLLLVHGHWCYDRLSRIILYFFYKNASFVLILLCYQLYTGFSGSSMIDQMYLMVFNLLFTSVPPIIVGIYDQDAPKDLLLSKPQLYAQGRESRLYKPHSFWINILDALYQAIVLFFFGAVIYEKCEAGMYEFGMTVTHSCLVAQLLHMAIETKSWTVIHVGGIVLSIVVFYLFGILYTMIFPAGLGSVSQFGELQHAMTTPIHWLTVVLTSILAVLPRFVVRSLRCSLNPDDITQALIATMGTRKRDFMVSWSRSTSASSVYRRRDPDF